jgi:hypothetical protein
MRGRVICLLLVFFVSCGALSDDEPRGTAVKPIVFVNLNCSFCSILLDCCYAKFADELRSAGYDIRGWRLDYDDITDEFLTDIDIFCLVCTKTPLLDEAKGALRRFLRGGGSVLIIAWRSSWNDLSNLASFTKGFGIWFGYDRSIIPVADILPNSPLNRPNACSTIGNGVIGIAEVLIDSKNAAVVAQVAGREYIAAALSTSKNLGKGRLVVIGSPHYFRNVDLYEYDNLAFTLNLFDYLSGGGADLKAMLAKISGKKATAGGTVKLVGKIKNISDTPGEATQLRFLLADSSSYPVGPAANVIPLKTVGIASLAPGKSLKVKTTAKVPDGTLPGDYYLVVVVDPDNETDDPVPSNNYMVSKKSITIY